MDFLRKPVVVAGIQIGLIALLAASGFASGGEGEAHGGGHGGGAQLKDFMWRCIDFAALVVIIVWAVKKADMKKALADRQATIEKSLREADEMKASAEKKFAEYNEKIAQANRDTENLQKVMREEGLAEKARIIAESKIAAERIKEQAKVLADQEIVRAKTELREEAARLSVELAEQTLKGAVKQDDQNRLVGEYLTKVVELN
ncbi:MAG: ATP synthase F0 subunit B [Geobacteraceae bacterium]|nr:ATP synthase F0 subunit B [Geobacteraceae bacterium]